MSPLLQALLQQVEQLPPEERLELIQRVAAGLQQAELIKAEQPPKYRVSEFRGIAPNLLEIRDAQAWVNELRSEWDERERQIFDGL